ncbi:hypothetical protein CANCADRAFT_14815, partial [Tortispora caseinolytica NRRL Y-17796]
NGERLILIGDVHGAKHELKKLLNKINVDYGTDRVVLLGDFIAKGPDSLEVVNFAIQRNLSCIRGNHEQEMLRRYAQMYNRHGLGKKVLDAQISSTDLVCDDEICLAKHATIDQILYIANCPLMLDLDTIPLGKAKRSVLAHAGLMWNVDNLIDQDPEAVLNMRMLLPPDNTSWVDEPVEEGVHWATVWNDYQRTLPEENRTAVVYGHYAAERLDLRDYSFGLDSACVKGNHLSALVV